MVARFGKKYEMMHAMGLFYKSGHVELFGEELKSFKDLHLKFKDLYNKAETHMKEGAKERERNRKDMLGKIGYLEG